MRESSPSKDLLHNATSMGPVTLFAGNLDTLTSFYRDAVNLSIVSSDAASVTLGSGGVPLVILQHSPKLARTQPGSAGLYHTAILFETQAALAAALFSVAQHSSKTFTGSSDHLVSQAFYFTDPEGNGVELS